MLEFLLLLLLLSLPLSSRVCLSATSASSSSFLLFRLRLPPSREEHPLPTGSVITGGRLVAIINLPSIPVAYSTTRVRDGWIFSYGFADALSQKMEEKRSWTETGRGGFLSLLVVTIISITIDDRRTFPSFESKIFAIIYTGVNIDEAYRSRRVHAVLCIRGGMGEF